MEPECAVCLRDYLKDEVLPVTLLCGHTFCRRCTRMLTEHNKRYDTGQFNDTTCPLCKQTTHVAACACHELPQPDNLILHLLEKPSKPVLCRSCLLPFNETLRYPTALLCGCSYCASCVTQLSVPSTTQMLTFRCEACQLNSSVEAGESLCKNFAALDLLKTHGHLASGHSEPEPL